MEIMIISAFVIYFCILASIGLLFYLQKENENDFVIGGRSINYFVTAIATQASDMSSWLFLGVPAMVYLYGLPEAWIGIGLVTGMFINWHCIAPRLRTATAQYHNMTISGYFESRLGDTSGTLRALSALFALYFFTCYIASSIVGLGRLFEAAFGIDYSFGIIIGLACAMTYTLLGGFIAVAWCDLFQGLFLLAAIVIVPVYTVYLLGGWGAVTAAATAHHIPLTLFPSFAGTCNSILLAASWGLGYFGQPHILTNFMAIDDTRNIRYAKYVGITWQIIVLTAAISIGLVGLAYFHEGLPNNANTELLFILLTKQLFFPLLAGFILCGILAATLSTMDRHILISGSVLAEDMYKRFFNKQADSRVMMNITRLGSLAISAVALFIARTNNASIYELVNYAWSGLGSSFGPLVIMCLYSNTITRNGAIAGLIAGGVTAGIWPYLSIPLLPLVPGFTVGLLTIYGVSKIESKKKAAYE